MIKHTRTICKECKRQWLTPSANFVNSAKVSISGNRREDLCDYCGSSEIELVEYSPPFLGGDYPYPEAIPIPNLSKIKDLGEAYDPSKVPQHAPGFIASSLPTLLGLNETIGYSEPKGSVKDIEQIITISLKDNSIYDLSDMD